MLNLELSFFDNTVDPDLLALFSKCSENTYAAGLQDKDREGVLCIKIFSMMRVEK